MPHALSAPITCYAGERDIGCLVEVTSQHRIAAFRDSGSPVDLAGCVSSGRQSDIGSDASRGVIRMAAQFLPQLKAQNRAAIVNVSSGLAFVPLAISPVYCATKAAIHSFTQSLRIQLKNTNIAVFELAPPITATPLFSDGISINDIGVKPMDVTTLVKYAIDGLERDRFEIRPGPSNRSKIMSRLALIYTARECAMRRRRSHDGFRDRAAYCKTWWRVDAGTYPRRSGPCVMMCVYRAAGSR